MITSTRQFTGGRTRSRLAVACLLMFVLTAFAAPAFAQPFQDPVQGLARVGPVAPANGYPRWYQDKTGITLEFCSPQSQAELDGGYCLLLPGDTTFPEVFPSSFADEHFYWAADAIVGDARLILGLEAAFGQGPVKAGDQVVFGRLRIRYDNLPASGTYTVYTPYGKFVFPDQAQGGRLIQTFDIGFGCPAGQFDCALTSHIGPFLLASDAAGGAELPPITFEGRRYIAAPTRSGPVTGSPLPPYETADGPLNANVFRIEGPDGQVLLQTTNFTLMGRVFEGAVPGRVESPRATYTVSGADIKIDAFATAFAPLTPRIPGGLIFPEAPPILAFFPAPCVGPEPNGPWSAPVDALRIDMFSSEPLPYFWAQASNLTRETLPVRICLEDSTARNAQGQTVPTFSQIPVTDLVRIQDALYNASDRSLTVTASSSDPLAQLSVGEFGGGIANGRFVQQGVNAPPSKITVNSLRGGRADLLVSTSGTVAPPPVCAPSLSATSISLAAAADSGSVDLTGMDASCAWTAASDSTWLTVGPPDGSGNATIQFSYGENTATTPRVATLTIAGVTATVTQEGTAPAPTNCVYTVTPSAPLTFTSAGGQGALSVTTTGGPGCTWTASSSATWITVQPLSSSDNGDVLYNASANTTFVQRTAVLTIAGTQISVTQASAQQPPVAVNDAYAIQEDAPTAGAVALGVLANDTLNATGTIAVQVTVAPGLGTATPNADGTITYRPAANASGNDLFRYTVSVNGVVSNVASVSVSIAAVNDAPAATPDGPIEAALNTPTAIAVLANDLDVDNAVLAIQAGSIQQVSGPAAATITAGTTLISFTASVAGAYTFTYRATDGSLASNNALVTVNVTASAETITVASAQYRIRQTRWVVSGTDSVRGGQPLALFYQTPDDQLNGREGVQFGTTSVTNNGTWLFDSRTTGLVGELGGRVVVKNPVGGAASVPFVVTIRQ